MHDDVDMASNDMPMIALRGDAQIPQLGFGTFLVPPPETAKVVSLALQAGYRHIDTAAQYANGRGSGGPCGTGDRARRNLHHDEVRQRRPRLRGGEGACHASLERLDLGPVELYLIHWPVPTRGGTRYLAGVHRAAGRGARAIDRRLQFPPAHLERLIAETGVTPAVNQIELHPRLAQHELRRLHAQYGIVTEAWSPLARGALLEDPVVTEVATAHGRTPAQVLIRWHLQIGNVVIPKSVTPARIEENFDVFGFELAAEEIAAIDGLDRGERIGPDPNTFVTPVTKPPP